MINARIIEKKLNHLLGNINNEIKNILIFVDEEKIQISIYYNNGKSKIMFIDSIEEYDKFINEYKDIKMKIFMDLLKPKKNELI